MFRNIIFRLGLRYISRRFFQSLLFIIGVALGVAVVIAIDLANGSASRAFSLSTESISGRSTHQIVGSVDGISSDIYTDIRLDLGIRLSAPVVNDLVRAVDVPQPLRLLGIDPFSEPPFRNYLSTIEVIGEDDIDVFEVNEAFASQASYSVKKLGIPKEKLNPRGGAIALGHPLGCTGGKLSVQLINEMRRRKQKYGMVTMCVGTGQGAAGVIELLK